jgi:hypothetical protein
MPAPAMHVSHDVAVELNQSSFPPQVSPHSFSQLLARHASSAGATSIRPTG